MTEGKAPAGGSTGLSGNPNDLSSVPTLDVDAAETAPPAATLAMALVRRKSLWVVGAVGLLSAGLLLVWQRNRQE